MAERLKMQMVWMILCHSLRWANVLTEPYKAQYLNVYEKAHLLVCASISIREK
jgi:hypothetical protein